MGYTIPNAPDASITDQSEPDSVDFVTLGNRSSGVVSGCVVSASSVADQNVVISSGEVLSNKTYFTIVGETLAMGQGDATGPRFDLVVVNSSGVVTKRSGPAGSNPTFPTLVTGDVVLAAVYRAAGTSDIITSTRIIDKSILQPTNTSRTGTGSPTTGLGVVGDTYVNTALSSNSGQSQVWVKTTSSLWENLAEYTVPETTLNTANTLVRRDASGNFAAGTITAATVIANLTGNVTGNVTGTLTGNITGNASGTASRWASARTITVSGNASGSVSLDGSANVTLSLGSIKASSLLQSGSGTAMTFNWAGQSGQPNYLWGSNDGVNHYVWTPSNFSVAFATNSSNATTSGTAAFAYSVTDGTTIFYPAYGETANTVAIRNGGDGVLKSNYFAGAGTVTVATGASTNLRRRTVDGYFLIEASRQTYKKNIESINTALSMVNQLNPVTFKWKNEFSGPPSENPALQSIFDTHKEYGFIVEEVAAVNPELVTYMDDSENNVPTPMMWQQNGLIALLVKAVQELSTKIESLESAK